jgi:hypothetical protein
MQNIFSAEATTNTISRIEKLNEGTPALWGKMNASQMLADLSVPYEMANGLIPTKYNGVVKLMMKLFLKSTVVGNRPYKKSSQTAPVFVISDDRDFETEKARLIENIKWVESQGESFFEGKESAAFGKLSAAEWGNQFTKHNEHHFTQFGV